MTGLATLTSKNQLTLPANLVDFMGLTPGVRFWVEKKDKHICLQKIDSLREIQGVLANHPLARKYSADEIVRLARKKKINRLYGSGS